MDLHVTKLPRPRNVVVVPKTCARCGRGFGTTCREYLCSNCRKPESDKSVLNPRLSFREKQVVRLVQQAKSNKEIAYELCLTVGTVKEYLYRIFRKLQVTNRTELALRGRDIEAAENRMRAS
jgi:DNA-binding NarL/FixJ family response regulator